MIEAVRVAPNPEEGFLDDLFREVFARDDAHGNGEGEASVLPVEIAQRLIVAIGDALEERFRGPLG